MTNELLVNIGRHLTSPTWTHTAAWEIQKLSELGQLTRENAAIINEWAKQIPPEVRATMEETRRLALEGIEKDLAKAAEDGYVTPPLRDSTVDVLNEYGQQAVDKMNMVNTTMLESSVNLYRQGIATVMSEEQAAQAQGILNEETGAVVIGTETRTQALQRAIGRINDAGITGFYDRAGRSWSAEAYVNMDIRTTVHNTAIQSVKNRMDDYGVSVFQVSAHAGARPLCYPYQGKMYSWDNIAGEIEDGNGKTWKYAPLNSTSYGQAAGLFGVNCGHEPIVMIPGVTIPHAQDFVQPKDENDKAYAESQEQRALERKIRAAKRAIEMGDDSPEAKQKVKDAQKEMREFINRTGRTRRYDREQLYGAKKAPSVPKENENVNSQLTTGQQTINKLQYKPATTIADAEAFARDTVGIPNVSYKGVDLRVANAMNESLVNAVNYSDDIKPRMQFFGSAQERNKGIKADIEAYYTNVFQNQGYSRSTSETWAKKYASAIAGKVPGNAFALAYSDEISGRGVTDELRRIVGKWAGIGVNTKFAKDYDTTQMYVAADVRSGFHPQGTDSIKALIDHEFGHQLDYAYDLRNNQGVRDLWHNTSNDDIKTGLSRYGAKNIAEFIAEAYSEYVNNPVARAIAKTIGSIIDREAGIT